MADLKNKILKNSGALRAITTFKKIFYKHAREIFKDPSASRIYVSLNREIEALTALINLLHIVEHEHWNGEDHHGVNSMEIMNGKIMDTAIKYGMYEDVEIATHERKYYKYSSVDRDVPTGEDEDKKEIPPYPADHFDNLRLRIMEKGVAREMYRRYLASFDKTNKGKKLHYVKTFSR